MSPDFNLLIPIKGCVHDIRNMLSVIEGKAFLVSEKKLPDDVREYIQNMEYAAQYAEALCGQLMQCLSLENVECEPINLSDMVDEIDILLMSVISKKDFIDFELEKNLPNINGIPAQLKQVVINLTLNASQAIGNNQGIIRITTNLSSSGEHVELTISDNGCGMNGEMLNEIFDMSFTTKVNGTGVGLCSVHSIIQKHGGTISVDSNLNHGSIFRISLQVIAG